MNPASVDIKNFIEGHPALPPEWVVRLGNDTATSVPGVVRLYDNGAWYDYQPNLQLEHPIVKVKVEPLNSTTYAQAFAVAFDLRVALDKELASALPMCEGAFIQGDIVGRAADTGNADIHFEVRLLRKVSQ